MEEVTDEPLYRDRVCGIDIGKAGMVATIRVPSDKDPARRAAETRGFGTTKREVLALADWLRSWQVPAVVMEATGDYWKGPFYRLEAEGFDCVLADARQVKHLPGRPENDPGDSRWLAACFERGAVTSCFVATPEFRVIRLHTRYRRDLTDERTREKQRAEKLLESAAIKLSSVVTDLHGVTGRDIMDHLIAGERGPEVLAQLARARARRKITELEAALEGAEFFTPEHAALLAAMLERIDRVNAGITRLTGVIERLLEPYEEQLRQAESMPGWRRRSAENAIAETGADMTRFPTGAHLASWAGRTPLDNQSGKRNGRAKSKKGNRYLAAVTGETAVAAGKTQTREGARYRRLARRRGKAKAQVALGNTQMKVYHALLSSPGTRYTDLGPDYYERQASTRRQIAHHVGKLSALGFEVTLCRIPDPNQTRQSAPRPPDHPPDHRRAKEPAPPALPHAQLRLHFRVRTYSNRFASHILRYRQAYALIRERGWVSNFLGPHDGGYDGHARRDFLDARITAVFDHYAVDEDSPEFSLCSTDRVFFHRTSDRTRTPIPLDEIPDLLFSEAMRDVDLFVAVTSIALDPQWADRGDNPHLAYWQACSFGELGGTAVIRRETLARLVPKLTIADRLELADRFLRVRGKLHTYKIHIGSGNIPIEPDDRYLCIVPATAGRAKVMLPFDDDPVLSLILSKAALLVADHKVTDPTIVSQLGHRAR